MNEKLKQVSVLTLNPAVDISYEIPQLLEYLSEAFTLLPGDVVITGTPSGVGAFRKPPLWLADGDLVEVEVEGLGVLRNRCALDAAQ